MKRTKEILCSKQNYVRIVFAVSTTKGTAVFNKLIKKLTLTNETPTMYDFTEYDEDGDEFDLFKVRKIKFGKLEESNLISDHTMFIRKVFCLENEEKFFEEKFKESAMKHFSKIIDSATSCLVKIK